MAQQTQNVGIFGKLLGLGAASKKRHKVDLNTDDNTFYYNEQLGRWVERGKENEAVASTAPPPPPSSLRGSAASSMANLEQLSSDEANGGSQTPTLGSKNVSSTSLDGLSNFSASFGSRSVRARYADPFTRSSTAAGSNSRSSRFFPQVPGSSVGHNAGVSFFVPGAATADAQQVEKVDSPLVKEPSLAPDSPVAMSPTTSGSLRQDSKGSSGGQQVKLWSPSPAATAMAESSADSSVFSPQLPVDAAAAALETHDFGTSNIDGESPHETMLSVFPSAQAESVSASGFEGDTPARDVQDTVDASVLGLDTTATSGVGEDWNPAEPASQSLVNEPVDGFVHGEDGAVAQVSESRQWYDYFNNLYQWGEYYKQSGYTAEQLASYYAEHEGMNEQQVLEYLQYYSDLLQQEQLQLQQDLDHSADIVASTVTSDRQENCTVGDVSSSEVHAAPLDLDQPTLFVPSSPTLNPDMRTVDASSGSGEVVLQQAKSVDSGELVGTPEHVSIADWLASNQAANVGAGKITGPLPWEDLAPSLPASNSTSDSEATSPRFGGDDNAVNSCRERLSPVDEGSAASRHLTCAIDPLPSIDNVADLICLPLNNVAAVEDCVSSNLNHFVEEGDNASSTPSLIIQQPVPITNRTGTYCNGFHGDDAQSQASYSPLQGNASATGFLSENCVTANGQQTSLDLHTRNGFLEEACSLPEGARLAALEDNSVSARPDVPKEPVMISDTDVFSSMTIVDGQHADSPTVCKPNSSLIEQAELSAVPEEFLPGGFEFNSLTVTHVHNDWHAFETCPKPIPPIDVRSGSGSTEQQTSLPNNLGQSWKDGSQHNKFASKEHGSNLQEACCGSVAAMAVEHNLLCEAVHHKDEEIERLSYLTREKDSLVSNLQSDYQGTLQRLHIVNDEMTLLKEQVQNLLELKEQYAGQVAMLTSQKQQLQLQVAGQVLEERTQDEAGVAVQLQEDMLHRLALSQEADSDQPGRQLSVASQRLLDDLDLLTDGAILKADNDFTPGSEQLQPTGKPHSSGSVRLLDGLQSIADDPHSGSGSNEVNGWDDLDEPLSVPVPRSIDSLHQIETLSQSATSLCTTVEAELQRISKLCNRHSDLEARLLQQLVKGHSPYTDGAVNSVSTTKAMELERALQARDNELSAARDQLSAAVEQLQIEREQLAEVHAQLNADRAEFESKLAAQQGVFAAQREALLADAREQLCAVHEAQLHELQKPLLEIETLRADYETQMAMKEGALQELSASTSAEIESLKAKLAGSSAQCEVLAAELASTVADRDVLRAGLTASSSQCAKLTAEFTSSSSECNSLKAELSRLQDQLGALNGSAGQLTSMQAAKEAAENEVAALKSQLDELSQQLTEASDGKKQFQKKFATLRRKAEEIKNENALLKEQVSRHEQDLRAAVSDKHSAVADLEAQHNAVIEDKDNAIAELKAELATLRGDVEAQLQAKCEELQKSQQAAAAANEQLAGALQEVAHLKEQLQEAQSQMQDEASLEALQEKDEQIEMLRESLQDANDLLNQAESKLKSTEEALASTQEQATAVQSEVADLRSAHIHVTEELRSKEAELAQNAEECSVLRSEGQQLRQQLEDSTTQLQHKLQESEAMLMSQHEARLAEKDAELQQKLEQQQAELELAWHAKETELHQMLADKDAELAAQSSELGDARCKLQQLSTALEEATKKLEEAAYSSGQAAASRTAEIQQLTSDLQSMSSDLTSLRQALADATSRAEAAEAALGAQDAKLQEEAAQKEKEAKLQQRKLLKAKQELKARTATIQQRESELAEVQSQLVAVREAQEADRVMLMDLRTDNQRLRSEIENTVVTLQGAKDMAVELETVREMLTAQQSEFNDLLACLGQESAKVQAMQEVLQEQGFDVGALLDQVEEEFGFGDDADVE